MIDLLLIMFVLSAFVSKLLDSGDEGQNVVDRPGERIFNRK